MSYNQCGWGIPDGWFIPTLMDIIDLRDWMNYTYVVDDDSDSFSFKATGLAGKSQDYYEIDLHLPLSCTDLLKLIQEQVK